MSDLSKYSQCEVSGVFLFGIKQAFLNLSVLPKGEMLLEVGEIDVSHWYPYDQFLELIRRIDFALPESSENILFEAGANLLNVWPTSGKDNSSATSFIDWISRRGPNDYNNYVRGADLNDVGWCSLLSLDKVSGHALYDMVMPLRPEFITGVIYAGCNMFRDIDYVSVDWKPKVFGRNPFLNRFTVRVKFKLNPRLAHNEIEEKIARLRHKDELPFDDQELKSIAWRYKSLCEQFALFRSFHKEINYILAHSLEEGHRSREDLEMARRKADESAAAKGLFLANMSHEMRTPMNAIIGLSALALKNEMPTRVHDYLEKIRGSGEHLLGIINDVLDMSKIDAGKLRIDHVPFEINEVLGYVVNLIAQKAEAKGLKLIVDINRDVPRIMVGDPLRLRQILINFAGNAIKFTFQGQVCINLNVIEQTDFDIFLRFEVRDTGIGLSEAQIANLFHNFSQADSSITRQFGGTGLGLAISKSLAEEMGGKVGVNSTLACGSTFWFTVRLGKASADKRGAFAVGMGMRGKGVLVISDDVHSTLNLCAMCEDLGLIPEIASTRQGILDAIQPANVRVSSIDFVITDWPMSQPGVLRDIDAIRSLSGRYIPLIYISAPDQRAEDSKVMHALGMVQVLARPLSIAALQEAIVSFEAMPASLPSMGFRSDSQNLAGELEVALQQICGARILLVEDNRLNQQVAYELLTDAGFVVDLAEDGQKAVNCVEARVLEELPYDLILMDMQMPVMDGVTAARLIRLNYSAAVLPIVAMTANAMQVDQERCLAAGMNDFLTKPIAPTQLWRTLLRWIALGEELKSPSEMAQTSALPNMAMPEQIEGLDLKTGLMLMGNNQSLYLKTLATFVSTQSNAIKSISKAVSSNDVTSAADQAHTLKSHAGYLGAKQLEKVVRELEDIFRDPKRTTKATDECLATAAATLEALLTAVRFAFPSGLPLPTLEIERPSRIRLDPLS
ncbi:response regulator [Rhodoferax aquaticus]|uniref:Virulence sensor protein BvgS n=1 Tax=Rhodoferax aquaticus TaxID=2527691 RepID=A0A515ESW3_9BURK|nr:response regulator [Rhodoferax aquaticus]QDL55759.1 response regulator [Rhodoferax aquaticus]